MKCASRHPVCSRPPRAAGWIIRRCSQYEFRFSMEGDLREAFEEKSKHGIGWAKAGYSAQTMKILRSYSTYRFRGHAAMVNDYLKIAWRNITKHKGYAFITIVGLTIGLACCLLILLFIRFELSFDRFHEKADRIYRLVDSFERARGMSELSTS